jgi:7,8-dihydropterin-6-yl-methyl-4-(beta-D-ribofuranosyl)aminobenzene 5'-phosphate synthase
MNFTVLVENESHEPELAAEHGISIWVEAGGKRILFDTGASSAFAENADRLGIRIEDADILVLSHAHADHTGGLRTFFERNKRAPVYVGRGILGERYSIRGEEKRAIGMPPDVYDAHRDRFHHVAERLELAEGVGIALVGEVQRRHPLPSGNRHLFREREGRLEEDPFVEELYLWIREPGGVRVISGCSHAGILNIVEAAEAYGPVSTVVGGFHLKGEEEGRIRDIARALSKVGMVYTGHCTGRSAYEIIRDELGERAHYAATGTRATA